MIPISIQLILQILAIVLPSAIAGILLNLTRTTKDKHPQYLRLNPVTATSSTPVAVGTRSPTDQAAGVVMEILNVDYELRPGAISSPGAPSADEANGGSVYVTEFDPGATEQMISDTRTISKASVVHATQFAETTETGGAGLAQETTISKDLTGGDGHGPLTASKEIFLGTTWNGTNTNIQRARLGYRLVQVTLEELLGMVTSLLAP